MSILPSDILLHYLTAVLVVVYFHCQVTEESLSTILLLVIAVYIAAIASQLMLLVEFSRLLLSPL